MGGSIIPRQSNFGPGIAAAFLVVVGVVTLIFFQSGAINIQSLTNRANYKTLKVNNLALNVRVARTPAQQSASLNNIKSIAQNEGMLFVFDQDGVYNISTTNMLFPVDLMWINSNGDVVDAQANIAPGLRDPVHTQALARYVLMVNAGVMDHNDITVHTSVDLSGIQ